MKRKEYNRRILKRCTKLLQSHDASEVFEGVILSAYLIEQAFKSELRKINPLLYFDKKSISDEMEVRVAVGNLTKEDLGRLKTANANRCIAQMCEHKKDLTPHKGNFKELFEIRNFIVHSTDDFPTDENSVAETAVSALRASRKYVIKHSGVSTDEFNPLTSAEFNKLQKTRHAKRINDLENRLKEHQKIFKELKKAEVLSKIRTNLPKGDPYTWIEEPINCPACGERSFDKVGVVDFDWTPDGVIESGWCHYQCRVCELELSEREYELYEDELVNRV